MSMKLCAVDIMKKIIFLLLVAVFCASVASADNFKVGVLLQLNMSEHEYKNFVQEGRENIGWHFLSHTDENFVYYDSLTELQLALNAEDVGEVQLPEVVGEYFVNSSPNTYSVSCVTQVRPTYFAMGVLEKNVELRDKLDKAIAELKSNGTLTRLIDDYIHNYSKNMDRNIEFAKFPGAETVKFALTGDLPPIDFVAADDTPAGFNVALLAEIGKLLKINIDIIDIYATSRAVTLTSERADVVFWFKVTRDYSPQPDIVQGLALTDSYYEWDKFLHIKLKKPVKHK